MINLRFMVVCSFLVLMAFLVNLSCYMVYFFRNLHGSFLLILFVDLFRKIACKW